MNQTLSRRETAAKYLYLPVRLAALASVVMMFFPGLNPAKICDLISKTMSLFTSGLSYSRLVENCIRPFNQGWVSEDSFVTLYYACTVVLVGIILCAAMGCMSVGNLKLQRLGNLLGAVGSVIQIAGLFVIRSVAGEIAMTAFADRIGPSFPALNWTLYLIMAIVTLIGCITLQILLPRAEKGEHFAMADKYRLFLMFMPFAALCFVFSYLPLYGWRYAFFDYTSGSTLSWDKFVGFKWFTMLLQNPATRADIVRVLRNTLAMSGLGLATSWCAMAFAIFLNEIKTPWVRRFVQTFTTIPNFISWVLVYAIALAIFAGDGFISSLMTSTGVWSEGKNMLMDSSHMWLKMLAWGMWKGIGWSAIIYIAGISGIDQGLYEAAEIDGAGRFAKMWHVTVPCLIPTFMVLFLMAVAGILSNGMDQYLVFENAKNSDVITVLDLYVYKLGIGDGQIPLSTMIGMLKSAISVVLLFGANAVSKLIRGESIM